MMATENGESTGQGPADPAHGKYLAAGCDSCRRRFKLRKWREGVKCPKCGSGELTPIPAPGGAVDYFLADRSGGYAQADIRLAQWAKWAELITPRQYELAFIRQNRQVQEKKRPRPIHELLVEEEWITSKQAEIMLQFMCRERPDADDQQFADAVLAAGLASPDAVEDSRKLQETISRKANETPPLCQVMLEKRILNEARTLTLLKNLQKKGQGPLKTLVEAVKGPARTPSQRKGVRRLAGEHKQSLKQAALIIVLFACAVGIWYWQSYEPPYRFLALCESCEEISRLNWSPHFPHECPVCRRQSAYVAGLCRDCEAVFPIKNPYAPQTCPECNSSNVGAMRAEDMGVE